MPWPSRACRPPTYPADRRSCRQGLSHHPLGALDPVNDPNHVAYQTIRDERNASDLSAKANEGRLASGASGENEMIECCDSRSVVGVGTGLVSPSAPRKLVKAVEDTKGGVTSKQTDKHGEVRITMMLGRAENGRHELVVRVIEARGLKPADLNGLSDPYTECALCDDESNHIRGSRTEKTRTITKVGERLWYRPLYAVAGSTLTPAPPSIDLVLLSRP